MSVHASSPTTLLTRSEPGARPYAYAAGIVSIGTAMRRHAQCRAEQSIDQSCTHRTQQADGTPRLTCVCVFNVLAISSISCLYAMPLLQPQGAATGRIAHAQPRALAHSQPRGWGTGRVMTGARAATGTGARAATPPGAAPQQRQGAGAGRRGRTQRQGAAAGRSGRAQRQSAAAGRSGGQCRRDGSVSLCVPRHGSFF